MLRGLTRSRPRLDALETQLFDSGINGNSSDRQFMLKHRRYDEVILAQSNFILIIPLRNTHGHYLNISVMERGSTVERSRADTLLFLSL